MSVIYADINATYTQFNESCAFSNYALAGSYYASRPIIDFFNGYFNYFILLKPKLIHYGTVGAVFANEPMLFSDHFHQLANIGWGNSKKKGGKIALSSPKLLENLHTPLMASMRIKSFKVSTLNFSAGIVGGLNARMIKDPVIINILIDNYGVNQDRAHCITIFHSNGDFYERDTNIVGILPLTVPWNTKYIIREILIFEPI
jgi:hypothetical protein